MIPWRHGKNWYSQNGENELRSARWVRPLPKPVTSWPYNSHSKRGYNLNYLFELCTLEVDGWPFSGSSRGIFRGNYDREKKMPWWPVVMSCSIIPTQLLLHPDFWVALPKTKSLPLKMGRAPKGKDRLPTTIFQGKRLALLLWKTYPGLPFLPYSWMWQMGCLQY